ncbi:hypothetical protein JCM1840_005133 [Sporobolomyces johnsonii]
MPLPLLSSAYLAQQAIRSAASSTSASSSIASLTNGDGGKWHFDNDDSDSDSDATEDESARDDTASMVDERFLDPQSEAGIATTISGYCASLSPLGRHYALELPRNVLQTATQYSETLNSGILTVRAQRGDQVLAVCHSRLAPEEETEWNAFYSSTSPLPCAPSSRTSSPPSSFSADRSPRPVPNRHPHLPTPAASSSDDDQSIPPPTAAAPTSRPESALSVSSAVFHTHTLPLSAPPPPRRRSSPSPFSFSFSSTSPTSPGGRLAPAPASDADADETAEEEEQEVEEEEDDDEDEDEGTTAELSALLDQVLARAIERDHVEEEEAAAAAPGRGGRRGVARVVPGASRDEFVFELREEEEVEEELEDEDYDYEEAAVQRRRRAARPRENVGR